MGYKYKHKAAAHDGAHVHHLPTTVLANAAHVPLLPAPYPALWQGKGRVRCRRSPARASD